MAMSMKSYVVLLFPIWQLDDRHISFNDLVNMKPQEQADLLNELMKLPDEEKINTNEYGELETIDATILDVPHFQNMLNDEDLFERLREYYIIFLDEYETTQLW